MLACGPVPFIRYKLDDVVLQITAVDPLASIYNSLLTRHRLIPLLFLGLHSQRS